MKNLLTVLFSFILILNLISCEKDDIPQDNSTSENQENEEQTNETDTINQTDSITQTTPIDLTDTVEPGSFWPAYPGSYWEFDIGVTFTVSPDYKKLVFTTTNYNDGPPVYDSLYLPELKMKGKIGYVRGSNIGYPGSIWSNGFYFYNLYSDSTYEYRVSEYTGSDSSVWYDVGKQSKKDTTITVKGVEYNSVLVMNEYYVNSCGTDCFYKRTFLVKDIGPIRIDTRPSSDPYSDTIPFTTQNITSYFINK